MIKKPYMTHKNIQQEIATILSNMGIAERAITGKASFIKDLGLDSLDFAELVMELETAFDVEIPILEAEKFETVLEAVDYIQLRTNS